MKFRRTVDHLAVRETVGLGVVHPSHRADHLGHQLPTPPYSLRKGPLLNGSRITSNHWALCIIYLGVYRSVTGLRDEGLDIRVASLEDLPKPMGCGRAGVTLDVLKRQARTWCGAGECGFERSLFVREPGNNRKNPPRLLFLLAACVVK